MGDYLRSAFSNWVTGSSDGHEDGENQFVGQQIELKGRRLKVDKVIAEGGFGFVFRVRDMQTQDVFALKRLIAADKEAKKEINNEIEILTKLQPHPHVMKFISWGLIGNNIYLLLSEYCGCGSLKDIPLPIKNSQQLNRVIYQASLAIKKMHKLNIIHRDLKIENILFDNEGYVKLCDFGSATIHSYEPDHNWTPIQRSLVEDEMTRHTTPMYRPPEILDTYLHYPINTAMDIWAFGCLLYLIKFGRHPFEDSAKLRIINCNYSIPSNAEEGVHIQLIKSCLKVNPRERIKIEEIISLLESNFVDLGSPCVKPRQITPTTSHPISPVHQMPTQTPGSAQPVSMSFSGFTRYLKETSTKVMQSVQLSINRQEAAAQNQVPKTIINHGPIPVNAVKSTFYQKSTVELQNRDVPRKPVNQAKCPPPIPERPKFIEEPHSMNNTASGANGEPSIENAANSNKVPDEIDAVNEAPVDGKAVADEKVVFVDDLLNLSTDETKDSPSPSLYSEKNMLFAEASSESKPDVTNIDLLVDTSMTSEMQVKSPNSNFDLLNDIFSSSMNDTATKSVPTAFQQQTQLPKPDLLFNASNVSSTTTTMNQQPLHRNTSTPNLTKLDPFTELGAFATSANCVSPTHQKPVQAQGIPRVASYSTFQASSNQSKPDYSRIHFAEVNTTTTPNCIPKCRGNEFEDLLQDFPRRPQTENTNKSMAELKKQELIKEGMSPEKLMVLEWKENKTRNIRALLSSLHTIVWEDCAWQKIGMHQLINNSDVKKMYRKACIAVHPDKVIGTPHEELAKLIFVELNDAWTEFEKQQGQV
ncbi:cyclin-G-associated kinase-like protein [Dinothrombium tinctorium]|uniref:Cyclin-G-associated kinase-like protein n=1 Tax=Dinothrombium tinctorium TaxID=1965070 RepID=A0A3S3QNI6_9ACAR|nr:cyclin-G-associated kinase-like protein [Dinothrombium tinctorium]RWS11698.1 cyclin-G-associated kinase-like protein [Dinothrombium tinctorium]RWS12524.1 cyclin-G-associated kinase-like protein [Dinothrombium tinctorium]